MKKTLLKPVLAGIGLLFIILSCQTAPAENPENGGSGSTQENPEEQIWDEERPLEERLSFYESPEDAGLALDVVESLENRTQEEERLFLALLVTEQRLEEAAEEGDRMLRLYPEDLGILYLRALTAYQSGDKETLDTLMERGLALSPEDGQLNMLKANLLVDQRKYSDANKALVHTLNEDPNHFQALILKSDVLMHLGKGNDDLNEKFLQEAVKVLNRLEQVQPDYPYTYVDRARVTAILGDISQAYNDLTKAIELQPDVEWHYVDRARLTLKYFNDIEGALEDLKRCEEINPNNFLALVFMAGIHFDLLEFEKSLDYYNRVVAINPDYYYAYENMGALNYSLGNYKEAKADFLKAYDQYDANEGYILMAALSMMEMGQREDAAQLLTQVSRSLERGSLPYEVFRYYIEGGSDYFVQDKIRKETDEHLKNRYYYYLGELYLFQESLDSAQLCFEKASNLDQVFEGKVANWHL